MEHAHKFDLSNPAMREALLDLPGTVVYGKNQAAYRRGSDERSGTLPERETIREALSHFDAELRGLLLDPEKEVARRPRSTRSCWRKRRRRSTRRISRS